MAKNKSNSRPQDGAATHNIDISLYNKIAKRALYYSTQMIHLANNRDDAEKGDPKVGGHPAACASSTHLLGALHLHVRRPEDFIAVKPHASPMDHAYGHLLEVFFHAHGPRTGEQLTADEAKEVMTKLRHFTDPSDPAAKPAFQSYHAAWDPDNFHFFPSGSVGIPPVVSAYTALAYRFAENHKFEVPKNAHFWSIIGDSEFREGSLHEAMPDIAERELGNVTWIVDYNRQNLDGTRIKNEEGIAGTDAERIERVGKANGWFVDQLRHGKKRLKLFAKPNGETFKQAIEDLSDFELQALLIKKDAKITRQRFVEIAPKFKSELSALSDSEVLEILTDLGGHDFELLIEAYEASRRRPNKPTLIVAHTIKGWGLDCQAQTGNHSMMVDQSEVDRLREQQTIPATDLFALYDPKTAENKFLANRGALLRNGIAEHRSLRERNYAHVAKIITEQGGFPTEFGINLKLSPWANTQWMWGQLAAKLIRIANASSHNGDEAKWLIASKHIATMAPDVGTSTNLNPSMDGKIYAPQAENDFEAMYNVKDSRRPNLIPLEKEDHRHLRFEIEEGNAMSCCGAFGKMLDHVGIPFLPLMTVYDFFIKRALDQYFYNLYWKSGFILVGTPSGVSLSPEGAQHSWKSDIQIPNGITWEPAFSIELDWIFADAVRRHFTRDNKDREGVLLRAVTRGLEQKQFIENLRKQNRFTGLSDAEILARTREDVLQGGYWLVHHEGAPGYAPGDNVVHLAVMGALAPEAIAASEKLLATGIFANILVVTSPDLLLGTLGRQDNYTHLRKNLNINSNIYINTNSSLRGGDAAALPIQSSAELLSMRGGRIPILAICDGEAGLLDNIGSVVGTLADTLAVRKHSKSGTPKAVYAYHHLDADSIAHSAERLLEESASEELIVHRQALN